jgi:YfiH family protein
MSTHNWIKPDWPLSSKVGAISTTKVGGVSLGNYASLNLGLHVDDKSEYVLKNRETLKSMLALSAEPAWLNQVHSTVVLNTNDISSHNNDADASVSFTKDEVCVVMTADCLPVLFANKQGTKVAAAHAGWRGLVDGILEKTVTKLDEKPENIIAWLGPAIGADSFEVGDEVRAAFVSKHQAASRAFKSQPKDKWLADIYELARIRLNSIGLENIYGGGFDTMTDERFFSYRANNTTGRMASLIWIKE